MNNHQEKKLIVLSGGGTLGSVTPLLAIYDELKNDYNFLFIGTEKGVERKIVADNGLPFLAIKSGKLRRYWSWQNFIDPFLILAGFFQSFYIFKKYRPSLFISAGSFVSVGSAWAAWFLRVPILIHQLDYDPGLANKLMASLASKITVSFKKSLKDYGNKAIWTGSPIRHYFLKNNVSQAEAKKHFSFKEDSPVIFVLGGGTGSLIINHLVIDNLHNLSQLCQIIHLSGNGKEPKIDDSETYLKFSSFSQQDMIYAYRAADLVVSRAGMATLLELANLSKPSIIIPMPDSHQETNAKVLAEAEAALVLKQKTLTSLDLYRQIKKLLADETKLKKMGENLHQTLKTNANKELVEIIKKIM